jgi:hypothetical protein
VCGERRDINTGYEMDGIAFNMYNLYFGTSRFVPKIKHRDIAGLEAKIDVTCNDKSLPTTWYNRKSDLVQSQIRCKVIFVPRESVQLAFIDGRVIDCTYVQPFVVGSSEQIQRVRTLSPGTLVSSLFRRTKLDMGSSKIRPRKTRPWTFIPGKLLPRNFVPGKLVPRKKCPINLATTPGYAF